MTDNTRYGDFIMAADTDDFFRWLTCEQMPRWADGDVESPVGWYAIVCPEREDVLTYAQDNHDQRVAGLVRLDRWYLVQIDTLGFVYTVSYEGLDGGRPQSEQLRRALADFNRLNRHFSEWCGS